jgi:hypothetical protein
MSWQTWRRVPTYQWIVVLSVISVYLLTFCVLLPILCHSWVNSPYFVGTKNDPAVVRQVILENDQRYQAAKNYLHALSEKHLPLSISVQGNEQQTVDVPSDLVIGMITVNRDKPMQAGSDLLNLGYLTQSVAQLIKVIDNDTSAGFSHKHVFVCNVDPMPHLYVEAQAVSRVVHTVLRYANVSGREKARSMMDVFEKEKDDYAYCLDVAQKFNSRYVLMLEDDVLLSDIAFAVLSRLMARVQLDMRNDWLFVKLYYPEKWQGFGNEWQTAVELTGVAAIGGSLMVLGISMMSRHFHWRMMSRYSTPCWFVVGAAYAVLLCVGVGRPYIFAWRRSFLSMHRLSAAPGCCTQAVLYPAGVVSKLATHLRHVHANVDFSVDLAIDGFAHKHHLMRYLIEPNVLRHIGLVSTVRDYAKSAEHFL